MPCIALIQQHASLDVDENLARALAAVDRAAAGGARIVCFAELAFTPFYPQRVADDRKENVLDLAEPVPGPTTELFATKARDHNLVIVLNLYERDGEHAYDTSPVIDADGTLLGVTRMVHITDYPSFREQGYYAPGDRGAPVYHTRYGAVGVAICYDRHYPEYMRALALGGAEVVFVPQAGTVGEWPDELYEAEVRVAAFQNGYFAALCNRVGVEGAMTFAGESFACAPDGRVIARAGRGSDAVVMFDADFTEVERSDARRLFLRDRRPELYGAWWNGKPNRGADGNR